MNETNNINTKHKFDFRHLLIVIAIILITNNIVGGLVWYFMDQNAKNITDSNILKTKDLQQQIDDLSKVGPTTQDGLVFTINNTKFDKGEPINATITNESNNSYFFYYPEPTFFYIQYFKDGQWVDIEGQDGNNALLSNDKLGESCGLILYERPLPGELKPSTSFSEKWDQTICPTLDSLSKIENIKSGQYRLSFEYGSKIASDDQFRIAESKIIYSNTFTIK